MVARLNSSERRALRYMNPVSDRLRLDNYLDVALGGPAQIGEIFYCDPTLNVDTYDGKSPDKAKQKLQSAIDLCVANRGDVVIRMRGSETVTSTILFDCAGMSVIAEGYGMAPLAIGEYFACYAPAITDEPVGLVSADGVTIAGLGFAGADAGGTFYSGAALLLRGSLAGTADAAPFGARIVDCRFPKWGMDNRIGIGIDGSSDCIIEHCSFEGVTQDFASGIYVQGATQNLEIIDNRFRSCTYGVLYGAFAGGGPHAIIKSNVFEDSKILSVLSNAPTHVCDNWSELAVGAASFSGNYATLAGFGVYCSDNHYKEAD